MLEFKSKKGGITSTLEVYELPFDVILEILTWLPVKTLLRFKCVCKQWCSLIKEDRKFIATHMVRSVPVQVTSLNNCEDSLVDYGLSVEKGDDFGCRIRNPAIRQVLYLPYADEDTVLMNLYYDPVTGDCKVLLRHDSDDVLSHEFEIITAGKDNLWRPLYNIGKSSRFIHIYGADKGMLSQRIPTDSYKIQDLEIHSFDMRSECVTTNTVPFGAFEDLREVSIFCWKSCRPAVSAIVNEALHVLVLEDFKEHKWSKNKIIVPLKLLKDDPLFLNQTLIIRSFYPPVLRFVMVMNDSLREFSYDTERESLTEITDAEMDHAKEGTQFYMTSLVTIKGMVPENAVN